MSGIAFKSSRTLYEQLADTLRDRILTGEYTRDEAIPSEPELCRTTGYSRSTVRRALAILVDEGVLTKVHGKGTFVSGSPHTDVEGFRFMSFTETMAAEGKLLTTRTVDVREVPAGASQADFLGVAGGEPLVEIVRLRYVDGEPFCIETNSFTQAYAGLAERDLDGSLYQILRSEYHVVPANGKKSFEVCFATQNEAFLLEVAKGTALMLVVDYVSDDTGKPLHISKRVMRTDCHKYTELR